MTFNPTSKSDRVIIVDFNHMAHNFSYAGVKLSRTMKVNGVSQVVDTTIANGTIKNIFNWSKGGKHPTVVCFDRPCPCRKAYFMKEQPTGVDGEYKGKRESMGNSMYEGVSLAQDLLEKGGVKCVYMHNWEADDLVFLAIQRAKEQYPNHYIDVITNDADMLPLVDEQVSVFFRSKKFTWAESKDLEKNRYIQVTPSNFQEVVEGLSAFNNLYVPYNTLLLYKILRGDSADGIVSPFPKGSMSPRRLATLIWQMQHGKLNEGYSLLFPKGSNIPYGVKELATKDEYGFSDDEDSIYIDEHAFVLDADGLPHTVDIGNLFVYTPPHRKYVNSNTGQELTLEEAKALGKEGGAKVVHEDNPLLDKMVETLIYYGFTPEEAQTFRIQYKGMNLAQPFPDLPEPLKRGAKKLNDIPTYDGRALNTVVGVLDINLNSRYL